MANEVVGPILGTVVLAGINGAGQPVRVDQTALVAGMGSDGKARWLLVDSSGNVISSGGVNLGSTPSTQAMGDAASGGSDATASKNDHKHGIPALGTTAAAIGTSAGGSATTPSKSDHVHAIPDQLVTSRMANLDASITTVATSQTTTSLTYVDLATVGPAVTLTTGVTQDHLIIVSAYQDGQAAANGCLMTPAIAGAAAVDGTGTLDSRSGEFSRSSAVHLATGMASPSTHTAKYRVEVAGTSTWINRNLIAVAV